MRKPAKSYSDEFKRDALLLLAKSEKSQTEIERDLGLSHGLLRKWRLKFEVIEKKPGLDWSELEQLRQENRRLKRENAILQEEREILKKTVSIFSKANRG